MALFFTKRLYFRRKKSFMTPVLFSLYFHTHPITLLLQILGGLMHGPSPHLKFWGTVPLSLRPWSLTLHIRGCLRASLMDCSSSSMYYLIYRQIWQELREVNSGWGGF